MSFLSVLKTIGHDALIGAEFAQPIVSVFAPEIAAPMGAVLNMIVRAEQTYTTEKAGATKKQVVMDEFTALLPMFQAAMHAQGWDISVNANTISNFIDAAVAQFNAAAALKGVLTIQKVP